MAQYIIKKGDNLSTIAKNNGVKLKDLLKLNPHIEDPDYIQVGQKINLPSQSPTGKQLYDNNDGYPTTPVKKSFNITKPIWDKTTKGAAKIDTSANFNKTPTKTVVQKKPQSKNVKNKDVSFLQDVENDIEKYSQMVKTFINRKILTNIPGYDIGENEKTSKINLEKPTNPENFEFIKGNKIYDQEFGKNVYHSSRYIDLNNPSIKTNVHNRGQKYDKPIPFKEILFSNFDNNVFDDIHYLKRTKKLKNDSFYMGTDVNGKLIMGYGKDIQNINGVASPFTVIKNVKGFSKNKDQFKLQKSKFANKAKDPFLLDDQNNEISINILTSEDQDGHKKYGQYYGGSFILLSPDMKKKVLVSGSLDELDKSMEKFKKDNNLEKINVVKVDNGSYSRQFAVDQGNQIDQQFWNKYEGLNNSGGNAVYMYNNGGYVASDNIDIEGYTNPLKYFAAMGINISDDDCLECGGKIKYPFGGYAEIGYDVPEYYSAINNERPRDSATSYNQDVKGKFNWSNTLSKIPIEQIQKDIDSIPLTKNYMLNKTPKGYFNVYDKNNKPLGYSIDGKTLVPQEPNFEDGGLVKAWIQKFIKGGYIAGGGFRYKIKNLFKTQSQITPAVELNQGQTNSFFWNLNNQKVDSPYSNYKQFNVDPNQANTELDYNVVKKVTGNNIPMNNIPGKIDPTMILGSIGAAGDAITQGGSAIASMAGDETSAKALQKAGAIGKVAESFGNIVPIPGVGKALGAVTSIFAAPFTAWGEKIAKNEINKAEQQVNFFNRNTPGIWQPSYYGQTYSKYGSNIKNLEQRIMDDIYSDFDKYMKLT